MVGRQLEIGTWRLGEAQIKITTEKHMTHLDLGNDDDFFLDAHTKPRKREVQIDTSIVVQWTDLATPQITGQSYWSDARTDTEQIHQQSAHSTTLENVEFTEFCNIINNWISFGHRSVAVGRGRAQWHAQLQGNSIQCRVSYGQTSTLTLTSALRVVCGGFPAF